MLPLPKTAESVGGNVHYYANSAGEQNVSNYPDLHLAPRLNTYGLQWTNGDSNHEFAEAFLSDDYIQAMGIDPHVKNSAVVEALYQNILSTGTIWDSNSGLQNPGAAFAFSSTDPNPVLVNGKPPSSGSQTLILGAIGGIVVTGDNTDGQKISGTIFGDILSANEHIIAPEQVLNNAGVTKNDTFIYGFAGDDEIYGNNGEDSLYGGDGHDRIYGFATDADNSNGNYYNRLWGDGGDDILVAGSGDSAMDGGDGDHDAVSYQLSGKGVTVDLSTPPTVAAESIYPLVPSTNFSGLDSDFPGGASHFTGYGTGFAVLDLLANIEDIIGSKFDDTLTGNSGANIIDPGLGNDKIDSKGGGDILSYASLPRADTSKGDLTQGVYVNFHEGIFQKFDVKGNEYHDMVTGGFAGVIGSPNDDTLIGANTVNTWFGFSSGNDTINGGAQKNTMSYADALGPVAITVTPGTQNGTTVKTIFNGYETAADGTQTPIAPTPDGVDTFQNIDYFIGSAFDDTIAGGHFTSAASTAAVSPAASQVAGGEPPTIKFNGGAGKDTYVIEGSIGDIHISRDLSRITSDDLVAKLKNIEKWQFNDHTINVTRFDKAYTNLKGKDKVVGKGHDDLIVGHKVQADKLVGGSGHDGIFGLGGSDVLRGGKSKDLLLGGDGDDKIKGGGGNDRLLGGNGNDVLNGGAGANRLTGGDGKDTFVFAHLASHGFAGRHSGDNRPDTIVDFAKGDRIKLDGDVFTGLGGEGKLGAQYFQVGKHAKGDHAAVLYNAVKGWLAYAPHGADGDLIKFAKIGKHIDHLDQGDFVIA